jgi:antitoxin VapB
MVEDNGGKAEMSLNLKDPETVQLVRELSKRTGESLTTAVKTAVQERLERNERRKNKEGLMEWLDEVTKYTSVVLKDLPPSDKIGDLLYDKETGLPL